MPNWAVSNRLWRAEPWELCAISVTTAPSLATASTVAIAISAVTTAAVAAVAPTLSRLWRAHILPQEYLYQRSPIANHDQQ